ncbi:MAG: response regulator [Candidatus Methylomirabilales bacterium]
MLTGLSVLIVDDDPSTLQLLRLLLEGLGARATTAERPGEALRRLGAEAPDLLITDLRMPEMSGLDLIRIARSRLPLLGCVVVTGFATEEVTGDAFGAGAEDLLLKPISLPEVQARIQRVVEIMRLRREVAVLRAAVAECAAARPAGELVRPDVAGRAQELDALPALPGAARPVQAARPADAVARLERLGGLLRQGVITPAEFEEKKRALLQRI